MHVCYSHHATSELPSYHIFFIRRLSGKAESQENWMPAQNGRLDWVGVGIKINRGAVDIFGKCKFSISPEMENSHWLKGDKGVITLPRAYPNCISSGAFCGLQQLSSLTCAKQSGCISENRILLKEIATFVCSKMNRSLWPKHNVSILPTTFDETLIHQLCTTPKEMQMVRMLLFS